MITRLFTCYCEPPTGARRAEVLECLDRNLALPQINKVHFVTAVADWLPVHPKLQIHIADRRVTYQELLAMMADISQPADLAILANADIYFDDTLKMVNGNLGDRDCFAVCRHDRFGDGTLRHWNHQDSQDAWLFRGKPVVFAADYTLGKPGCDNRFAHDLIANGYRVRNPSLSVRAIHLHLVEERAYQRHVTEPVPPPYAMVPPSELDGQRPIHRVLHVALNYVTPQLGLRRALRSLGEYREVDWLKVEQSAGAGALDNVLRDCWGWQPDLTFMQLQRADVIRNPFCLAGLGRVVNWTGDVRQPLPEWYANLAPHCAATCFTNMEDVKLLRSLGQRAEYLQIGFDNHIFRPDGLTGDYPEIVFLGNDYNDRFPLSGLRREMARRLTDKYGSRFGVYGRFPGARGNLMFNEAEEARCYRSCKIAIGCNHYDLSRFSSDRVFRAMGSGACFLTKRWPDMALDFTENVHLYGWNTLDELEWQIDAILANEGKRKQVAETGCRFVHEHCTWDARMKNLKEIYHGSLQR